MWDHWIRTCLHTLVQQLLFMLEQNTMKIREILENERELERSFQMALQQCSLWKEGRYYWSQEFECT